MKFKFWPALIFLTLCAIVCLAPTVQMRTSSGTVGRVPYWTNGPLLSQTSSIWTDGAKVGIGATNVAYAFTVESAGSDYPFGITVGSASTTPVYVQVGATKDGTIFLQSNGTERASISANSVSYVTSGLRIGALGVASAVSKITTSTAILDFGSILAAASADLTISVPGVVSADSVSLGLPAAPDASIVFNAFVSSAGVVTVRAFNVGAIAVDPASATYRVTCISF